MNQCIDDICMSGGSPGADKLFGELANAAGHKVIHWSFLNHRSVGRKEDTHIVSAHKLLQADERLETAEKYLQRGFPAKLEYVNNLVRRNWQQVRATTCVYAACSFEDDMKPIGGTAYAIVMAIHTGIPKIFVYNVTTSKWMSFKRKYFNTLHIHKDEWEEIDLEDIPKPKGVYTGIGMSQLTENGERAIRSLYE